MRNVGRQRWAKAQRLVDATPRDRNRVVDLVRVGALGVVVLGHWLKQGLYVDAEGTLHRAGMLGQAEWTHPLTWVLQVMPLIFVVGGYANGVSWSHARSGGKTYGSWLRHRTRRLAWPVLPLLAFWMIATALAPFLGLRTDWVVVASRTSLVATWFVAAYLLVVALVPLSYAMWRRWGWLSIAGGAVAAAVVDVVSIWFDRYDVGLLNVLFVWGTVHQCGYAWLDQRGRTCRPAAMAGCLASLGALMLIVWTGPYGISMVGVDGFGLNNTSPPRVTVLLLGFAQFAGVLAMEPWLQGLARRRRIWVAVVLVDSRAMTVYLWHLTALSILAAGSLWLGGLGLHAYPATAEWWWLRLPWLLALALTTAALVAGLGRFEQAKAPGPDFSTEPMLTPLVETVLVSASLAFLASHGIGAGDEWVGWLVMGVCFVSLWLIDRSRATVGHPRWS